MPDLPTRVLGRTGLHVTTLGFGALELRGMVAGVGRPLTPDQPERILNAVLEYRKIKRPFPPTASAHPMPLCSRWCPRLTSARPPRTAHPGGDPTRAGPGGPAPPGATPRRRARTGRVARDGLPARLEGGR